MEHGKQMSFDFSNLGINYDPCLGFVDCSNVTLEHDSDIQLGSPGTSDCSEKNKDIKRRSSGALNYCKKNKVVSGSRAPQIDNNEPRNSNTKNHSSVGFVDTARRPNSDDEHVSHKVSVFDFYKSGRPYTLQEDINIIQYIINGGHFNRINGKSLYTEMSLSPVITHIMLKTLQYKLLYRN